MASPGSQPERDSSCRSKSLAGCFAASSWPPYAKPKLIMAIGDYIDKHNDNPKPFVSTAKASDILEKVKRARTALDNR